MCCIGCATGFSALRGKTQPVLEALLAQPSSSPLHQPGHLSIEDWLAKWAVGLGSEALLDPLVTLFQAPGIAGVLGYRLAGRCAVIFGPPLCAPEDQLALRKAFEEHCASQGWVTLDAVISQKWRRELEEEFGDCASIQFGDEMLFDPVEYAKISPKGTLKGRLNQAARHGVTIHECLNPRAKMEAELNAVADEWLAARKGLQIYYLHVDLFAVRETRRWFFARQHGKIVALLALDAIHSEHPEGDVGWLMHYIMAIPSAPPGTTELLLHTLFKILSTEGCRHVSAAVTPDHELAGISGISARAARWLTTAYHWISRLFNLTGRRQFWMKFKPITRPAFVFTKGRFSLRKTFALLKCLNIELSSSRNAPPPQAPDHLVHSPTLD